MSRVQRVTGILLISAQQKMFKRCSNSMKLGHVVPLIRDHDRFLKKIFHTQQPSQPRIKHHLCFMENTKHVDKDHVYRGPTCNTVFIYTYWQLKMWVKDYG